MTDEITAHIAEVRAEHTPEGAPPNGQYCRDDGYPWPCHAIAGAALLEAEHERAERLAAVAKELAGVLREHHDPACTCGVFERYRAALEAQEVGDEGH